MKIDDVVKMIRGPKGTVVRLRVQKAAGAEQMVAITRDVVVVEETYARGAELSRKKGPSYGYIHLPSFYGGRNSPRNAATDVRRLLAGQVQMHRLGARREEERVVRQRLATIDLQPSGLHVEPRGAAAHDVDAVLLVEARRAERDPSGSGTGSITPSAARRKAYCSESRSQACSSR